MGRVIHFEIGADNMDRAVKFYSSVFKWDIKKWEGVDYWIVTTGPKDEPGIDGGIVKRQEPGIMTINSIEVPSIEEYADKIVKAGGKVITPKMGIPGVGYFAYCQDTEGNRFGIFKTDPTAKYEG